MVRSKPNGNKGKWVLTDEPTVSGGCIEVEPLYSRPPTPSAPVGVEGLVAAWEADIAAAGPLNKKDLSPARFVRDLRALAQQPPAEAQTDPTEADNAKAADRACLAMIAQGYHWNGEAWARHGRPEAQAQGGGEVWTLDPEPIVSDCGIYTYMIDAPGHGAAIEVHGETQEQALGRAQAVLRTAPPSAPVGERIVDMQHFGATVVLHFESHERAGRYFARHADAVQVAENSPSAPVGVEGLVAKWRKLAEDASYRPGYMGAARLQQCASELESLALTASYAQQPAAVDGAVRHDGYCEGHCRRCDEAVAQRQGDKA